ncbi:MAG: sigma-54-dependent Fis family transcriptional regulator [bacterium]
MENNEKKFIKLLEASEILNSTLDLREILSTVINLVSEVMESQTASIYFIDLETNELVVRMAQGDAEGRLKGSRLKIPNTICGYVAKTGKSILCNDLSREPRWDSRQKLKFGLKPEKMVCVPMKYKNKVTGVIQVINKTNGDDYTEEELRLFQGFSNIAATAIQNASQFRLISRENERLKNQLNIVSDFIGNSDAANKIRLIAAKVAAADATVLLEGESGTGKEVVAQMIHKISSRCSRSFIPINCGAMPENLLESELFGHEKGAFTGATSMQQGLFEVASGGTIFLDEIGETSQATQVKLLRVLQDGRIRRVGSNLEISIDARVICATNKNLSELVKDGKFRQDLFYRLNVVNIKMPALRERTSDIPLLINYFTEKFSRKMKKNVKKVDNLVMDLFYKHPWSGNIRELENVIEACMAMCDSSVITVSDLPVHFQPGQDNMARYSGYSGLNYENAKADFERHYFFDLLKKTDFNVKEAAKLAGVSEKSISRRKQFFKIKKNS